MDNLYQQKTINADTLFDGSTYKSKMLYIYQFNTLPSIQYIGFINGERLFTAIMEKFAAAITSVHKYRSYDKKKKKNHFDETILLLNNNCLIELDDDYC